MIQGLILAAGKGRRLGSILNGKPKGLLPVGERTLIEHQVRSLRACGVHEIGVVIGHGGEYVRAALNGQCEFIENPHYATTNSLYSLWLARHWIRTAFIMVNSDVLADTQIYRSLVNHETSALAYDSTSGTDPEEMKVSLRGGHVVAISKAMDPQDADGESIGMIKFDEGAAQQALLAASDIIASGSLNDWSPAAVAAITHRAKISAIDVAGLPWTEIDFPEDLQRARTSVLTRIGLRAGKGTSILKNKNVNGSTSDNTAPRLSLFRG